MGKSRKRIIKMKMGKNRKRIIKKKMKRKKIEEGTDKDE